VGHEAIEAPAARAAGVGLRAIARRRGARAAADEEAAVSVGSVRKAA
jgi:hypothetical protein